MLRGLPCTDCRDPAAGADLVIDLEAEEAEAAGGQLRLPSSFQHALRSEAWAPSSDSSLQQPGRLFLRTEELKALLGVYVPYLASKVGLCLPNRVTEPIVSCALCHASRVDASPGLYLPLLIACISHVLIGQRARPFWPAGWVAAFSACPITRLRGTRRVPACLVEHSSGYQVSEPCSTFTMVGLPTAASFLPLTESSWLCVCAKCLERLLLLAGSHAKSALWWAVMLSCPFFFVQWC